MHCNWDHERSLWPGLLIPSLVSGALVACGAWWALGSGAVVVFVVGACVASAVGCVMIATRNLRDASAQLRRPELRGPGARGTGLYHALLTEALGLVEQGEAAVRDAEERRTAAETRHRVRHIETRRLEGAFDGVEQPVIVFDAAGRRRFDNVAARQTFGWSERPTEYGDESTMRAVGTATPGAGSPPVALTDLVEATRSRRLSSDRRVAEFDLESNGEIVHYRASARNVTGDGDEHLGVVVVLEDIRDERLARTRHAEFVSSVCHELKTPMASIRAFTEMLADGDVEDPDEQRELYGFIEQQVDRLTRLVDNMLNLARIESGVIEVRREDCELNDILQRALDVIRPAADEKSIRIVPELSDLYLAVHPDRDLLGQAVLNLLSNAVKYTPAGGEVRLRSRMQEDHAVIEVRDTGMGIPADALPHIFERFYRVEQNNKAAAGTGLGLALVHYIVTELHNGRIDVESTVGVGTCFSVTLPLGHRDRLRRRSEPALVPA